MSDDPTWQFYIPAIVGDAIAIEELRFRAIARGIEHHGHERGRGRGHHWGEYRITCRREIKELLELEIEQLQRSTPDEHLRAQCGVALTAIAATKGYQGLRPYTAPELMP